MASPNPGLWTLPPAPKRDKRIYVGFDVPKEWQGNREGYVSLLMMDMRRAAHRPTGYYVEE